MFRSALSRARHLGMRPVGVVRLAGRTSPQQLFAVRLTSLSSASGLRGRLSAPVRRLPWALSHKQAMCTTAASRAASEKEEEKGSDQGSNHSNDHDGQQKKGFWSSFAAMGRRHPFAFGVFVATAKTGAADVLVQLTIEEKKEVDWKRVVLFTAFGFAYLGVFQYGLYVTAFKRWFPNMQRFSELPFAKKLRDKAGLIDLAKQVGFDLLLHGPFLFFPVYYIMKEAIQGKQNMFNTPMAEVSVNALNKYKKNAVEDLLAFWKIWVPGDLLVMSLPLWLRLPVNHGISFVYVCVLSFMRGAEPKKATIEIEEPADILQLEGVPESK